ncbi:MAG: hypothetical protein ACRDT6_20760 [Micromonosporaceae bacterium]
MGAAARNYELFDSGPAPAPAPVTAPRRRVRSVPPPVRQPRPERKPQPERKPPAERKSREERVPRPRRVEAERGRTEVDATPVAPPAPVAAPRAPFVMLVLVLVAAGIIGLLVLNTRINENSFQLKALRDRQVALDAREQQLGSALADRQSPGNLAAAAKRLGLVPAGTPAFLQLPDGRVLGVPQPGGARTTTTGR